MSESEYDSSDSPTYLRREDSPESEEDSENEDVASPPTREGKGDAAILPRQDEGGDVTNQPLEDIDEAAESPSSEKEGQRSPGDGGIDSDPEFDQGVGEGEGEASGASDQESIDDDSGTLPEPSTSKGRIESGTESPDPGHANASEVEPEHVSPEPGLESADQMEPGLENADQMEPGLESADGTEPVLESVDRVEPELESASGMEPDPENVSGMEPRHASPGGMEPGPSNIHGDSDESDDELTMAVASTTKQVNKFLKDSDSEDESMPLPAGDDQEEGEKVEEGVKETLTKSRAMDDVFGESDEEVPVHKRKRATSGDDVDEESPVRKKIRESDDSGSEEEGSGHSAEQLPEEAADQKGEDEGVKEGAGSDDDLEEEDKNVGPSDWDMMMQRRKEAMSRAKKRRRKTGDVTINDDNIIAMIRQMQQAAELDRQLNLEGKAATKKLQMLPTVMSHLKKTDLQSCFIECGILSALADWLTPLPDQSLPHLRIRENILNVLKTYPIPDSTLLKSSKVGKAVMLLYRHPKEMRKNREKAGKLINEWARPIFGLASDLKSLSRDEREKRDYANLSQAARRRLSSGGDSKKTNPDEEFEPQKPGDKGWVGRARVPMPSTNDYVVRPKWNMGHEFKKAPSKKNLNRYEQQVQKSKQQKMLSKTTHAVSISVEGRHMPL